MKKHFVYYEHLTAIEEDPKYNDYGYKYNIGYLGCGLKTAYRTDSGFKHFLKVYNIKIDYIEEKELMNGSIIKVYHFKPFKLDESNYFWNIEEIEGYTPFIGLCNGSYVINYYKHTSKGTIIKRPNPNAKNVYNELDYHEMMKIYG